MWLGGHDTNLTLPWVFLISYTHMPRRIETILAQAGLHYQDITAVSSRDVIPPLHLSTTFERGSDGSYPGGFVYARHGNPTRALLEKVMTDLEGGADWSAAFTCGMQAVTAVFLAFGARATVLLNQELYQGIRLLLDAPFGSWGLRAQVVDMTDLGALEVAMARVFADPATARVLLWLETPSNPMLQIIDVRAVIAMAEGQARLHRKDFVSVLDTTWLTPYLLQAVGPLRIDLTLASATKFLGGHSDLLAGVLTGRRRKLSHATGTTFLDLEAPIRQLQRHAGGNLPPFEAWLLLRGLKSLPARMRTHCENAHRLAHFFASHPRIAAVHYLGLPSHPGHAVHAAMMSREGLSGSMMAIQVRARDGEGEDGREEGAEVEAMVLRVVARLRVFRRATSLGGTESLCEHRRSVEGAESRTPWDLVRLSVGLEAYEDLEEDWVQALGEEG